MSTKSKTEISDMSDAVKTLYDAMGQHLEPLDSDAVKTDIKLHEPDPDDGDSDFDESSTAISDYRSPWERLDAETDYGWGLFCHYRDSGLQRSMRATAKHVRTTMDQ